MNAYVSENHIMIGQLHLKDKENEIVAIPKLLDKLDIENAVVSIDAIDTQVNIAQDILNLFVILLINFPMKQLSHIIALSRN